MRRKRTRGWQWPPAGWLFLGLLLAMLLAGCTGSGGADVAASPEPGSIETDPPAAAVEEDPGRDGTYGDSNEPAVEPAAPEADTKSPDAPSEDPGSADGPASPAPDSPEAASSGGDSNAEATAEEPEEPLPFLIDLGATKCIPCKMMAPILEDLAETKTEYFEVIFYDVWEDRTKGQEFGIRAIPTQIFFSAQGEELFRHEGYFSRTQILDKWRELGVDVGE